MSINSNIALEKKYKKPHVGRRRRMCMENESIEGEGESLVELIEEAMRI